MSLDALIRKGPRKAPVKVLLYGPGGIGKSTFGASAPSPVFLAAEDDDQLDAAFLPIPQSWEEAMGFLEMLRKEPHKYESLVVDTVDWLQPLAIRHVCERDDGQTMPGQRKPLRLMVDGKPLIDGYGFGQGWNVVLEEFRLFVAALDRLRNERKMHIILLAHEHVANSKNPEGDDYGTITPSLNKHVVQLLFQWCNACLYATFDRQIIAVAEDNGKFKTKAKAVSSGERIMHTQMCRAHLAKNRYSLPETMKVSWHAFYEQVLKHDAADAASLRAELLSLARKTKGEKELEAITRWLPTVGNDVEKLKKGIERLSAEGVKQ